jgi:hypothetical protein
MNTEMTVTKKIPALQKRTVAVLTEVEMQKVDGGTTVFCYYAVISSEPCATVVVAAVTYVTNKITE